MHIISFSYQINNLISYQFPAKNFTYPYKKRTHKILKYAILQQTEAGTANIFSRGIDYVPNN